MRPGNGTPNSRSLSGFLESDLRQSLVLLQNRVASLEAYLAIGTSHETTPVSAPQKVVEPPAEEPS